MILDDEEFERQPGCFAKLIVIVIVIAVVAGAIGWLADTHKLPGLVRSKGLSQ